jgi:hypothetical protein
MTILQIPSRSRARHGNRESLYARKARERFNPNSFGPVPRVERACEECSLPFDPDEVSVTLVNIILEERRVRGKQRPSPHRRIRGRALGLDKTELSASETRAFLEHVKKADAQKGAHPLRVRLLPSTDD